MLDKENPPFPLSLLYFFITLFSHYSATFSLQIVKIKQDTVDSYLESILLDSLQSIAQDRAREFIVEKAKAIDLQAQEEMQDKLAEEALVQDLLYNCTIPEVVNIQTRVEEEDAKRRGERGECHGGEDREVSSITLMSTISKN